MSKLTTTFLDFLEAMVTLKILLLCWVLFVTSVYSGASRVTVTEDPAGNLTLQQCAVDGDEACPRNIRHKNFLVCWDTDISHVSYLIQVNRTGLHGASITPTPNGALSVTSDNARKHGIVASAHHANSSTSGKSCEHVLIYFWGSHSWLSETNVSVVTLKVRINDDLQFYTNRTFYLKYLPAVTIEAQPPTTETQPPTAETQPATTETQPTTAETQSATTETLTTVQQHGITDGQDSNATAVISTETAIIIIVVLAGCLLVALLVIVFLISRICRTKKDYNFKSQSHPGTPTRAVEEGSSSTQCIPQEVIVLSHPDTSISTPIPIVEGSTSTPSTLQGGAPVHSSEDSYIPPSPPLTPSSQGDSRTANTLIANHSEVEEDSLSGTVSGQGD